MDNAEIATATLAYIDEYGIESVSFRKMSQVTGIATMTICNRFGSKENLLRAALGVMLNETPLKTNVDESWDASLRRVAHHNRTMALAHPRAFPLFLQVPPFESPVLEYTRLVFSNHANQDLPEELPYAFLSVMHSFLTGFQMAERYASLAAEHVNTTKESEAFLRAFNEDAFSRNLDIIIRGLAETYHLPLEEKLNGGGLNPSEQ